MELFIFESFVFEQNALYRADFLSVTSDYRVQCARVGGGSNLGHLRFFSTSLYSCHLAIPSDYLLDIASLVQISTGSLFLHLMTIGANTVHS